MKKRIVFCGIAVAVVLSAVLHIVSVKPNDDETVYDDNKTSEKYELDGKTILIDPGHGGFDAGASANGIDEKDVNLAVSLKLAEIIKDNGGNVTLTRDTDRSTAEEGDTRKKAADLKRRKQTAVDIGADIMISIHMNKFSQAKYWGAQVFYAENSAESKTLGEAVQTALAEVLNDGNKRLAKESTGNIYLLKNVSCPTVIVECGFLSNVDEAKKLSDDAYRQKLAEAIYTGIKKYFDNVQN